MGVYHVLPVCSDGGAVLLFFLSFPFVESDNLLLLIVQVGLCNCSPQSCAPQAHLASQVPSPGLSYHTGGLITDYHCLTVTVCH